jgi:hypothetical protein
MQAMSACVEKLNSEEGGLPCPDFILVDGNRLPSDLPETKARSVVKVQFLFSTGCFNLLFPLE